MLPTDPCTPQTNILCVWMALTRRRGVARQVHWKWKCWHHGLRFPPALLFLVCRTTQAGRNAGFDSTEIKRFENVVEGARLQGLLSNFAIRDRGYHDDVRMRVADHYRLQRFQPSHFRHAHIKQNDLECRIGLNPAESPPCHFLRMRP